MKLSVYVHGREVASLEDLNSFTSRLSYHDDVEQDDFVSLTMPVRREPWDWDDQLHPIFQMNLPEGYLLQVLQEQFGPHIGGSPMNLLSVVGRNMIGRIQIAPPGAALNEPAKPVDVAALLQGDNSAEAFAELVREHATSGVSGVVPKFLDTEKLTGLGNHKKGTLFTHRHIIKGSSPHLPFVSLNEHLSMQVAAKVLPTAKTEISRDGQALVVDRFDVDDDGQPLWGMEDFCALLGMRPANKYETTWERIARAVRDHVPADRRMRAYRHLATVVLLTYALRNADCHAKNVALRYTSRRDVEATPVYDMLTTAAYGQYAKNPPGISLGGRKTWDPGRTLQQSIVSVFGVPARDQTLIVEQIGQAISEVAPAVREAVNEHPGFREIGKRMLLAWQDGLGMLRNKRTYNLGELDLGESFRGLSDPEPVNSQRAVIGRSELADSDPMG
ncbi:MULTISPECIES: type II toxin-antitoxin system HipA family toxin [Stenotrophomonas]|uniref:type II toxin-antitoxin system HipA family toxin n=1 Tax=Stenotrophomonas TaxID=40323 RepID=UPI0015DEF2D3|nr:MULTISPECIES: type II toxin-antitoxin system HipA family toxin [Stenotrophomonas]MBA0448385.1 type II toxin-antitoxin system HipA family toxin [Stenotrophomonas maltophilia]MDH0187398.1 type II toxin-antitoxin system HipA family toxin [Stenotrophomonas sp. GD04051]MDH0462729.1 type II toxin-antitoxin system HipA family toxin [Stenotrophomonas sp. GD03993]MDH0874732.1 type II toxin-antitoxin system HipA family toxin [Stenotrophomonas sp. GD03877]MDH2155730.1 type II toxin-antitoxin system Hi